MKSSDCLTRACASPLLLSLLIGSLLLSSGCATRPTDAGDENDIPFEERALPRSADERLSREDFEGPEKEGEASSDSLVDAILKIGFLDKERAAREAEERRQEEARQAELKRQEDQRREAEAAAERQRQAAMAEQQRQARQAAEATESAQLDTAPAADEPAPSSAENIIVEERETVIETAASEPAATDAITTDMQETPLAPPTPAPLTAQSRRQAREADKAQQYFTLALDQARNGQHEAALSLFRDIAAQYPSLSGPIVNQAIMLRRLDRGEEALALLQGSLVNKVASHYLLNELGILYREHGRFNQARQAYESAIRREPAYAKAYYNLGVLADLYLHDPALALDAFRQYQSLQAEPDKQVAGWIVEIERRVTRQ